MRQQVFSGAFEEAMRWRACAVRQLDTVCWFMLGCVAFRVYCHAGSAHKCKTRRICVLSSALDFAAGALGIEWGVGGSYIGAIYCNGCDKKRWSLVYR